MNKIILGRLKSGLLWPLGRLMWIWLAVALWGCAVSSQQSLPSQQPANTGKEQTTAGNSDATERSTDANVPTVTPPKSIAAWVPKGSGAFTVGAERVFHGIGGSASSTNPILLRASADNRSREELTAILAQFVTFVIDTYWNNAGGRESSQVGNRKLLNDTFLAAATETLSNSRIAGHWQDPKSGEFYSLCQLSLSDLITAIAGDTRLDNRSREYFLQNAEALYDQFSQKQGTAAS